MSFLFPALIKPPLLANIKLLVIIKVIIHGIKNGVKRNSMDTNASILKNI